MDLCELLLVPVLSIGFILLFYRLDVDSKLIDFGLKDLFFVVGDFEIKFDAVSVVNLKSCFFELVLEV